MKRLVEAAQDLDEAVELSPDDPDILVSRFNVRLRSGRDEDALPDLARALAVDPERPRTLRMLAYLYEGLGQPDEALKVYDQMLKSDPREPYALLGRSEIYSNRGMRTEALRDADALVALAPDGINKPGYLDDGFFWDFHAKALLNRASIFERFGELDRELQDLNAAVGHKRLPQTLTARGAFLREARRHEEALTDLTESIRLDPRQSNALYQRGLSLMTLGRAREALDDLTSAIDLRPDQAELFYFRARAFRLLKETEDAVRDVEHALKLDPRLIDRSSHALRHAGYWTAADVPGSLTAPYRDALRACMLDENCN